MQEIWVVTDQNFRDEKLKSLRHLALKVSKLWELLARGLQNSENFFCNKGCSVCIGICTVTKDDYRQNSYGRFNLKAVEAAGLLREIIGTWTAMYIPRWEARIAASQQWTSLHGNHSCVGHSCLRISPRLIAFPAAIQVAKKMSTFQIQ